MHELGHDCVTDRPPLYGCDDPRHPVPHCADRRIFLLIAASHLLSHSVEPQLLHTVFHHALSMTDMNQRDPATMQRHPMKSLPAASRRSASNVPRPQMAQFYVETWKKTKNAGLHNNNPKKNALDRLDYFLCSASNANRRSEEHDAVPFPGVR